MKLQRKLAALLTAALLIGTLTGCQETANVNKTLPEFSEDDVIYRSAWWCPKPTEENYKTYKESGLNTVMLVNHTFWSEFEDFWNREDNLEITTENAYYIGTPKDFAGKTMTDKSLALAKENGLYVYLAEGEGYFDWIGHETDVYEDFTIDYSGYEDTIVGVFSGDEPTEPAIAERASKISGAEKHFPDLPYFCNLFPWYADANTQLKSESYFTYLNAYCEQFLDKLSGPRLLSVDYYPFQGGNFTMWLFNYDLLAQNAIEHNADFHAFIQSCVTSDGSFDPLTENDVRLQVNTALAYGATTYSYYLYTPAGGDYISGLIDYDGKPVDMYYHAQAANAETASLEHAFKHYDYVCTMPISNEQLDFQTGAFSTLTNDNTEKLAESQILESAEADNRALVTLLRDGDGNEAFYLVNFYDKGDVELEEDCTFTLTFSDMKQVAVYGTTECLEGDVSELSDGTYECTLKPGEGALIVPFKK